MISSRVHPDTPNGYGTNAVYSGGPDAFRFTKSNPMYQTNKLRNQYDTPTEASSDLAQYIPSCYDPKYRGMKRPPTLTPPVCDFVDRNRGLELPIVEENASKVYATQEAKNSVNNTIAMDYLYYKNNNDNEAMKILDTLLSSIGKDELIMPRGGSRKSKKSRKLRKSKKSKKSKKSRKSKKSLKKSKKVKKSKKSKN